MKATPIDRIASRYHDLLVEGVPSEQAWKQAHGVAAFVLDEPTPEAVYREQSAEIDRVRMAAEREGAIIVLCVMVSILVGAALLALVLGWRP